MSIQENNIRLENNNTNLNEIYNAINNLPTLKLQDKSVTPTMEQQTITADEEYTGLASVTVNAVTSAIDSDIKATNIRSGVNILGVTGTMEEYVEPNLQSKSATPKTTAQTITPDSSYDGLSSVSISAVTSSIDSNIVAENIKDGVEILGVTGTLQEGITPTGTLDITENGEYDVTEYANATVNVEGAGGKYAPRYILFRNYRGTDLDYEVANLDTSNITNMGSIFYQCTQLKKLDLSSWNTKNTTSMVQMFYYCMGLNNLDISNFDTSNVTEINGMFTNCANLTSLNVSSFNTSKVTKMHQMFSDCRNLTSLDLSNFDTSNVTHIYGMFSGCNKLTHLDIRGFTFDKITTYSNTFDNIPADCLIIVKSDTEKQWILTNGRSDLTNIKTVAEYEAS